MWFTQSRFLFDWLLLNVNTLFKIKAQTHVEYAILSFCAHIVLSRPGALFETQNPIQRPKTHIFVSNSWPQQSVLVMSTTGLEVTALGCIWVALKQTQHWNYLSGELVLKWSSNISNMSLIIQTSPPKRKCLLTLKPDESTAVRRPVIITLLPTLLGCLCPTESSSFSTSGVLPQSVKLKQMHKYDTVLVNLDGTTISSTCWCQACAFSVLRFATLVGYTQVWVLAMFFWEHLNVCAGHSYPWKSVTLTWHSKHFPNMPMTETHFCHKYEDLSSQSV